MRLQEAAQGTARNSLPSSHKSSPKVFAYRITRRINSCTLKLTKLAVYRIYCVKKGM